MVIKINRAKVNIYSDDVSAKFSLDGMQRLLVGSGSGLKDIIFSTDSDCQLTLVFFDTVQRLSNKANCHYKLLYDVKIKKSQDVPANFMIMKFKDRIEIYYYTGVLVRLSNEFVLRNVEISNV